MVFVPAIQASTGPACRSRPMHVGDLPVHEPTDEHIRRVPHEASQREDLMALRMTPPVSANALANRGVGESDHRSVRRLENDPMPLDKLQRGFAIHMRVHRITWTTWTQLPNDSA